MGLIKTDNIYDRDMISYHTSVIQCTYALLDLLAYPRLEGLLRQLRIHNAHKLRLRKTKALERLKKATSLRANMQEPNTTTNTQVNTKDNIPKVLKNKK